MSRDSPKYLLFRCDSSDILGFGHLMRCISIAQEARRIGIESIFLIAEYSDNAINILESEKIKFYIIDKLKKKDELFSTIFLCKKYDIKNIILDISHKLTFSSSKYYFNYIQDLLTNDYKLSIIDGTGNESIALKYRLKESKIFLPYLIPDYEIIKYKDYNLFHSLSFFPIRDQFVNAKKNINFDQTRNFKILIALSGANFSYETKKIVEAINNFKEFKIDITVSGVEEKYKINKSSFHNIIYLKSSASIPEEMANSNVIIVGSGLIRYEATFMEIPSLIFSLIPDHTEMVKYFTTFGTGIFGGELNKLTTNQITQIVTHLIKNKRKLTNMRLKCKSIMDEHGAARIVNLILE